MCQIDVTDQRAVAELFDDPAEASNNGSDDVSDDAGVGAFHGWSRRFAAADILVNAAGVGIEDSPVAETPCKAWDRVIQTNLNGPFYLSRHFVRARKAAGGGGRVIDITSCMRAIPSPNSAAYGASKAGR